MRRLFVVLTCSFLFVLTRGSAAAQTPAPGLLASAVHAAAELQDGQTAAPPAVATEYSDAYRMRAKIHRISSFATIPLFATEAIVGQSLYADPSSGKKSAHLAVATGIGALFAVNTTTGLWNLYESRHDSNHRKLRLTHGLLMLGADVGFLTTAALGPGHEEEGGNMEGSASAHRAAAFTSIGLASAGYVIMLFGGH